MFPLVRSANAFQITFLWGFSFADSLHHLKKNDCILNEPLPTLSVVAYQVYEPRAEDVGLCLKVECTPVYQGTEYAPVFVISREVVAGELRFDQRTREKQARLKEQTSKHANWPCLRQREPASESALRLLSC